MTLRSVVMVILALISDDGFGTQLCGANEIDGFHHKRYIVSTATALTFTEAKGMALLGITQKTEQAKFVLKESSNTGTTGLHFNQEINSLSALWMEDFLLKSCKEKDGSIRVTALFPEDGLEYYPLPKEIRRSVIKELDKGYGVDIVHFTKGVTPTIAKIEHKCFKRQEELFCLFPVQEHKQLRYRVEGALVHGQRDELSKRGRIWATHRIGSEGFDISELVQMELINRGI